MELCNTNAPNRANTRAGVPDASRIRTGKSGLYFLIVGYRERMNSLLNDTKQHDHEHEANYLCIITDRIPADAVPDCEQRTRISRRAGEKALVNDMR
jgi:hypothetical protein